MQFEKCCKTTQQCYLRKIESASIQPRTSSPNFGKMCRECHIVIKVCGVGARRAPLLCGRNLWESAHGRLKSLKSSWILSKRAYAVPSSRKYERKRKHDIKWYEKHLSYRGSYKQIGLFTLKISTAWILQTLAKIIPPIWLSTETREQTNDFRRNSFPRRF